MTISLKNFWYAVASALISLCLHLLVLGLADRIEIGGLPTFAEGQEASRPRRLQVKSVEMPPPTEPTGQTGKTGAEEADIAEELSQTLRDESRMTELLESEQLQLKAPPKPRITGLGHNLVLPERAADEQPPQRPAAPRPEILDVIPEDIPSSHQTADRHRIPDVPRRNLGDKLLPSIVGESPKGSKQASGPGLSMRLSPPSTEPDFEALAKLEQEEKDAEPKTDDPRVTTDTDLPPMGKENGDKTDEQPQAIDRLVDANLTIYRTTAKEDGYFRLDLAPNPRSEKLRAIPKDVLFLIDCSNSIEPPKLEVFKSTVIDALNYLNPGDRFNIVSFRVKPHNLFDAYVPVSPDNITQGTRYVKKLRRQGMTDVYAALAPFVRSDRRSNTDRPLTVFIFTDGQSTVDDKLDNETLLRRIDTANREQVSIYSASCGRETNRFLLDLLAYTNRGRPLHRKDLRRFQGAIVGYVRSHTDIIVSDIIYSATGDIDKEMYPRRLPLMYRGNVMSVFGRWPADTEEIAIQLVGRSARDEPLDYVYNISQDEAESGTEAIKRNWIDQKVFYLIAEKTINPSPQLERELQRMLDKHNLETPYSD